MKWYVAVLKKYAVFQGRARRREFWMFVLFHTIIWFVLLVADHIAFEGFFTVPILPFAYQFAVFLPMLGVTVRRLHDTGRSGMWLLLGLPPLGFVMILQWLYEIYREVSPLWGHIPTGIATLVLAAFTALKGMEGKNKYGPDPKEEAAPAPAPAPAGGRPKARKR